MNIFNNRIRRPVERDGAAFYIFLTLLSFALSVVLTRLFLQLTGYPQLGGKTLHIAHLLWGGLLLFIGALGMLIFSNRWVYRTGSILSGVGVGLFIDEVGKFITRTNDYFYPPAAPIIYAFFLLVVLLYLRLRRQRPLDPRSELYRVFDLLEEVLEHDLDELEHAHMEARLKFIITQAEYPEQKHLAQELLRFIQSEHVAVVSRNPDWKERWTKKVKEWDERWVTKTRLKAVLVGGLGTIGLWSTQELAKSALASQVNGWNDWGWVQAAVSLQAGCGLVVLTGTILLIINRDARGVRISFLGLLLFLTMANLLDFYFDQFSTLGPALVQFLLLMTLIHYRRRFTPSAL